MLFGFSQFNEGRRKAQQDYATKRTQNLEHYKRWRELFPDAPISDHENLLEELSGGSNYLRNQLPSMDALEQYGARRDKERSIKDAQVQAQQATSQINLNNSIASLVEKDINFNDTYEGLSERTLSKFTPNSAGYNIAKRTLEEYQPTFENIRRKKMMTVSQEIANKLKEGANPDALAMSLGIEKSDNVFKQGISLYDQAQKDDNEDKFQKAMTAVNTNENIQTLLQSGDDEKIKQARALISNIVGSYGVTMTAQMQARLQQGATVAKSAGSINASESFVNTAVGNGNYMGNIATLMLKNKRVDGTTNMDAVKAQVLATMPSTMSNDAKEIAFKQLTALSRINMPQAVANEVKKLSEFFDIADADTPAKQKEAAKKMGVFDPQLIKLAGAKLAETKTANDLKKEAEVRKTTLNANTIADLESFDIDKRDRAITKIKNAYTRNGISHLFDESRWEEEADSMNANATIKITESKFNEIQGGNNFKGAIQLMKDGEAERAIMQLNTSIGPMISGDARQDLLNRLIESAEGLAGVAINTDYESKIDLVRKSADKTFAKRLELAIESAKDTGQTYAQSLFPSIRTKDGDDIKAIEYGQLFQAEVVSRGIIDLTGIAQQAFINAGKAAKNEKDFKTRFKELYNAAYIQLKGKSAGETRTDFITQSIAALTLKPEVKERFNNRVTEVGEQMRRLPTDLKLFGLPKTDQNPNGINDPAEWETVRREEIQDIEAKIKSIKRHFIQPNRMKYGALDEGTEDLIEELEKDLKMIKKMENPVQRRLNAEAQYRQSVVNDQFRRQGGQIGGKTQESFSVLGNTQPRLYGQ